MPACIQTMCNQYIICNFRYLNRFDEELEMIYLKQSISKNRANQHASRLSIIKMSMEREKGEYEGAGIGKKHILIHLDLICAFYLYVDFIFTHHFSFLTELMDLCDPVKYKQFISWDGDSINLQHFKLERISKKSLENHNKME